MCPNRYAAGCYGCCAVCCRSGRPPDELELERLLELPVIVFGDAVVLGLLTVSAVLLGEVVAVAAVVAFAVVSIFGPAVAFGALVTSAEWVTTGLSAAADGLLTTGVLVTVDVVSVPRMGACSLVFGLILCLGFGFRCVFAAGVIAVVLTVTVTVLVAGACVL